MKKSSVLMFVVALLSSPLAHADEDVPQLSMYISEFLAKFGDEVFGPEAAGKIRKKPNSEVVWVYQQWLLDRTTLLKEREGELEVAGLQRDRAVIAYNEIAIQHEEALRELRAPLAELNETRLENERLAGRLAIADKRNKILLGTSIALGVSFALMFWMFCRGSRQIRKRDQQISELVRQNRGIPMERDDWGHEHGERASVQPEGEAASAH